MNLFIHGRLGHFLQNEAGAEGGEGGGGAAPAAAPADAGSLLNQGGQAPSTDFIPEKYRVTKEDGSLDLEQSSRKLADSYKHLETRLGSGDAPPKTADEYAPKIEVEGFDWDEFKADPDTQSFLKGAHAKGLTNDQVSFVIGEYLRTAPALMEGGAQLSAADAAATLREVWGNDQEMTKNVQASFRAVQAFANEGEGVGSFDKLMTRYGNDPDFVAFAANIGRELREDLPVGSGGAITAQDFATKTSELRTQLQNLEIGDPKREQIQQQLNEMYAARHNQPASRINQSRPA